MMVPETVYTARLTLDKKSIRAAEPSEEGRRRRLVGDRDHARAALAHCESGFSNDFICHDGLMVSFRAMDESDGLCRSGVIDEGTIEPIDTESYFGVSLDNEIQFRFLLRVVLQRLLMPYQIFWQHEERVFAFGPLVDMEPREQAWLGQKTATRTVFRPMNAKQPHSKPVYKHFTFGVQFRLFAERWYLAIEPGWLFSSDGYRKSFAHPKLASNTARNERNQQIFSHTRFLSWFLTQHVDSTESSIGFEKNVTLMAETTYSRTRWEEETD